MGHICPQYFNTKSTPFHHSPPQYRRSRDWRYWKTAVKGVKYINKKIRIWDLKISGGIRGKAVNGGAVLGPGGEAVDGGAVLGGTV